MVKIDGDRLAAEIDKSIRAVRFSGCLDESFCILETQSGVQVQVRVTREDDEFMDVMDGIASIGPEVG